jgi:hypothetical protein
MIIQDPIAILRKIGFHKYNAKSNGESLLIHSYNTFFLVQKLVNHSTTQKYIQGLTIQDITKVEVAALFHDFGKTYPEFQKHLRGPHKLKDSDIPRLKEIIITEIKAVEKSYLNDIIYIIQNHHSVDLDKVTNNLGRLTRIVSVCDNVVSSGEISQSVINSLTGLIDSIEYEIFPIELINHPISSYVIGTFDYVYKKNGIEPILFAKNGTLFIKRKNQPLPPLSEINEVLNDRISDLTIESDAGIFEINNSNNRIYTNPTIFLQLASTPEVFIEKVDQEVQGRLGGFKKYQKEKWIENIERIYLYGRVCGGIHDSIIDILGEEVRKKVKSSVDPKWNIFLGIINKEKSAPKGMGGHVDESTVDFIEKQYGNNKSYLVIVQSILNKFTPLIKEVGITTNYDLQDLLIGSPFYKISSDFDIQQEAKRDYEKYWNKLPTDTCRICHTFSQITTTAALFPKSELGGSTAVFYTDQMRLSPELKNGGGICKWCFLWFSLLKNKTGNKMYKLCIVPHGMFGRIDWDDIFKDNEIIRIGKGLENFVYPHVAIAGLSGDTYGSFISQVVKHEKNRDSILQKMYDNGLRGKVISTLIEPSNRLFDCGGVNIAVGEYDLFKAVLENVKGTQSRNNYSLAVRAMKQKDRDGNIFPYAWGSLIKTNKLLENGAMIQVLGEKTGLGFLNAIWIGGGSNDSRVSNADKVVRRVNDTLRKLKDSESKEALIDEMSAIGLKVAISTRDFKTWQDERKTAEIEAFRKMAEKLYDYKDDSSRRTELVRSMAYYLAYVSKEGTQV